MSERTSPRRCSRAASTQRPWLLLTDVPAVEAGWGTPDARPLAEVTSAALREIDFQPGSMGPKVQVACRFVEATGGVAGIGALGDAAAILRGERGTRVRC